jgi:hypothetical protein
MPGAPFMEQRRSGEANRSHERSEGEDWRTHGSLLAKSRTVSRDSGTLVGGTIWPSFFGN